MVMALAFFLLIQAVAGPPVPIKLRKPVIRSVEPCGATTVDGDIVVCARDPSAQRIGKLPERTQSPADDRLSFRLPGGGMIDAHASQSNVGGFTAPGVAITLKIPFGKGKKD